MSWNLRGSYAETCSCELMCPCNLSFDHGATYDYCRATLGFDIRTGEVDGTDVSGRRIVNGKAYLRVVSGQWAGFLVRESHRRYLPGAIEHLAFPERPSVRFAAGTHNGYRYAADGQVLQRVTATLGQASADPARAWAVINGVPHFRISSGPWDGTWVPESDDIRMDA